VIRNLPSFSRLTSWGVHDSEKSLSLHGVAGDCGSLQVVDGNALSPATSVAEACAAFLTACSQERTAADPVLRALAEASSNWLATANVRQLRAAVIALLGMLEN
jgi:hypothetical protein